MPRGFSIAASDPLVGEAAEQAVLSGATAVQAALSGYFAAAGAHPGVLLGPLVILLSGYGAHRAFDGRVRQPGLGTKRPRGFLRVEDVPQTARVGVVTSVVAAFVALAYDPVNSSPLVVKAGVANAKKFGALRRAELLTRIGDRGASAFADKELHQPLLHVAGVSEQGLLTELDFTRAPQVDLRCDAHAQDGTTLLVVPWDSPSGTHESVCVIDVHGTAVCLAYQVAECGLELAAWELRAPLVAEPVMRGTTRLRPGTPLPTPANLAIELGEHARPRRALADDQSASGRATAILAATAAAR
jgi:gamma-glutamyltranspeptidase/glutathione hydrolase